MLTENHTMTTGEIAMARSSTGLARAPHRTERLAPDAALPKVCIIGAGSSGIATAKVLYESRIPFDCFEKSDSIGGMWVFKNANGLSSAYRSLHINTSRDKMAYSDFPMPEDYPDYPHHTQIAKYFNDYVDWFGFRHTITTNCAVTWVQRRDDGLWEVTLETGEKRLYDAVCVANGHHWDPRWPDPKIPGRFNGVEMHSHYYVDPTDPIDFRGKRVVVVGFGNSALDIACELGRKEVTDRLWLSMRRGYWVIPRYFGAAVLDADNVHPSEDPPWLLRVLPKSLLSWLGEKKIEKVIGRPEDHGLPAPSHPIGASHPAISHEIFNRIGSGDVIIKGDIERFDGDTIHFKDGSSLDADVVIYCTGYNIRFPFFDETFVTAPDNDIALWKRMIDPAIPGLYFIALVQPLCAMMPIAEEQSRLVAAHLTGAYAAPSPQEMAAERDAMHAAVKAGYVNSARHTIQINCGAYTFDLRKELKRGRARAKHAPGRLPIPPRAAQMGPRLAAAE
jgi:dimethylaniline monooxygenase (N-oxide forming)